MKTNGFPIWQTLLTVVVALGLIAIAAGGGAWAGYQWGFNNGTTLARTGQNPADSLPFQFGNPRGNTNPRNNLTRAFLGVQYEAITAELAKTEKLSVEAGAIIRDVVAGSPAEKAGFKVGDVITKVKEVTVDQNHSLADLVASVHPGEEVSFTVLRGSETLTLKATLGTQTAPRQQPTRPGPSG